MAEQNVKVGDYNYRMKSLRHSSERYGPCEVCKGHVSEVHYQVETKYFEIVRGGVIMTSGWTHHECHNRFGHKECLLSRRQPHSHELDEDLFPMDRAGQLAA